MLIPAVLSHRGWRWPSPEAKPEGGILHALVRVRASRSRPVHQPDKSRDSSDADSRGCRIEVRCLCLYISDGPPAPKCDAGVELAGTKRGGSNSVICHNLHTFLRREITASSAGNRSHCFPLTMSPSGLLAVAARNCLAREAHNSLLSWTVFAFLHPVTGSFCRAYAYFRLTRQMHQAYQIALLASINDYAGQGHPQVRLS